MGTCFLSEPAPPEQTPHTADSGLLIHTWVKELLLHGSDFFLREWHWSLAQTQLLHSQMAGLVAPFPWPGPTVPPPPTDRSWVDWDAPPRPYPAAFCVFFHALRVGLPWDLALSLRSPLASGFLSPDGRTFVPAASQAGPPPDSCVPLARPEDTDALTLLFSGPALTGVLSSHSLLPRPAPAPSTRIISKLLGAYHAYHAYNA